MRAKLENFMVDGNVEEEDLTDNNKLRIGAVASVFICGRGTCLWFEKQLTYPSPLVRVRIYHHLHLQGQLQVGSGTKDTVDYQRFLAGELTLDLQYQVDSMRAVHFFFCGTSSSLQPNPKQNSLSESCDCCIL